MSELESLSRSERICVPGAFLSAYLIGIVCTLPLAAQAADGLTPPFSSDPNPPATAATSTSFPSGDKNLLPDLGKPAIGNSNLNVNAGPGALTLEGRFGRQKVVIAPEYSTQTGLSLRGAFGTMVGDKAAIGVLMSGGADKHEVLINAGFKLDERQRIIFTGGQLTQNLDFSFVSGTDKARMTQNSGGFSYQYLIGSGWFRQIEVNGYMARTASRSLGDRTFLNDTATFYELWNDPRRIAGGTISGFQGRLGFSPFDGGKVKISLGQEHLSYDLLAGKDSVNRLISGIEWLQQIVDRTHLKVSADSFASQNRCTIGLERHLPTSDGGKHSLGLNVTGVQGRDGVGNDIQYQFAYSYAFGAGNSSLPAHSGNPFAKLGSAPASTGDAGSWSDTSLLDQVSVRPGFIPSRVIARVDTTATPTRLIAIDKTALPAGSTINTANGDVTVPLGVAVTSIAGVTKNLVVFANAAQFALSGNNLVIRPSQITQPAVGVTDSYAVTVNNSGGGTTVVTVMISHGSVKIDRIVVSVMDTTPPLTTVAPNVAGTTSNGTTLSVTINEAGTGYYLVLPSASAAPNLAAVLAGTSFAMSANVAATPAISGLVPTTAYKIYFVAKDTANNVQLAVQNVAVTTLALPAGYVTQGGLTWTPNTIGGWNGSGYTDWSTANTYCMTSSINGQTGWRLPTPAELNALYASGALVGKPGWVLQKTWASTSKAPGIHYNYYLDMGANAIGWNDDDIPNYASCVR
ncbi:MAG: DUF1566 domain-containing protein [Betaproteobacteria bacterium]